MQAPHGAQAYSQLLLTPLTPEPSAGRIVQQEEDSERPAWEPQEKRVPVSVHACVCMCMCPYEYV